MDKYRLYIDESGHHRYQQSEALNERYLGLTGIAIRRDVYEAHVVPRIEQLRALFYTDYDLRPPLHLTDIMAAKNSFSRLQEQSIKNRFNEILLPLLSEVEYRIFTVVIDKNSHQDRYSTPAHPYHYNLTCMLERYCKYLKYVNGRGDVMAEARGKAEDRKLSEVYAQFYDAGTDYATAADIQARLTTNSIKLKTKSNLIQGLEFADLLALSSKIDVLHTHGKIDRLDENFTTTVINTIQSKYYSGATSSRGNGTFLWSARCWASVLPTQSNSFFSPYLDDG